MCDIEERLIRSVKHNACLYNKSDTGFRNRPRRDIAWATVSSECGLTVKETQCKWKTLRDRFVREYHKCADTQMEVSHWRYFEELLFLLEHIKPRGCSIEDSQLDLDVDLSSKHMTYENDDLNRRPIKQDDDDYAEEANTREALTPSDASNEKSQPCLQQAQQEFHKVMGLLENVLQQKLKEQPSNIVDTQHDPFYKYLESILSRVDATTRADIQLELLNSANTLVKNAENTKSYTQ
ncbi:uncharacterized protein LOC122322622 isoform X2 [Drosophila grimshawi]|uniref:uncharacterized protein LOC122322622 isoform X2 n=1 Tax=Drosophila grimshawi TaxID=7222 RepID=UPI001C932BB2|nr:uncharacterized protein LOC122322622 isoform X2 [Drosophila grimshawi]